MMKTPKDYARDAMKERTDSFLADPLGVGSDPTVVLEKYIAIAISDARKAAIEECARVAEQEIEEYGKERIAFNNHDTYVASRCVHAIRAIATEPAK